MASEPDDYQTISDNCPGYMVLISAGIICTRCEGEKRHKPNDCPKPATAAELATDHVPGGDQDGMEDVDSGMESLSDTESLSSESTVRSDNSEMRVTNAHQSDQGGTHPHDTRLPRRGFARPDVSHTSTQPDRTSLSPTIRPATRHQSSRVRQVFGKSDGQSSDITSQKPGAHPHHNGDAMYGPNPPASDKTYSIFRSGTTQSTRVASNRKQSSTNGSNRSRKRSHSDEEQTRQTISYGATRDRLPSESLADTMGKFEYSNTTCPSSFGFGMLPSEAMG